MRSLCSPAEPSTKSYQDLIKVMKEHLQPAPAALGERYRFGMAVQKDDESIHKFCARLKALAMHCNYGEGLNTQLRDRFVLGVQSESTKKRLLEKGDALTFDKAVEIATAMETTSKDLAGMHSSSKPAGTLNYLRNDRNRNNTKGASNSAKKQNKGNKVPCTCCGRDNHEFKDCRYKDYECRICKRKGHLIAVCRKNKESRGTGNKHDSNDSKKNVKTKTEHQNFVAEEFRKFNDDESLYKVDENEKDYSKIKIIMAVENFDYEFEIDTGSPISAISELFYKQSKLKSINIHKTERMFRSYTGDPIIPIGILKVKVTFKDSEKLLDLFVMPGVSQPIIGREWLNTFKIIENCLKIYDGDENSINACHEEYNDLIKEFSDVFTNKLGTYKEVCSIEMKPNIKPIYKKARPIPFAIQGKVKMEIDRLVEAGVLIPVKSSEWATPVVPVVKKDGHIRPCGDYRVTINPHMVKVRASVPNIEECLADNEGSTVQSVLDLKQAYQQIKLDKKSQELTTINTPWGLYQYTRLNYGIASAAGIFLLIMQVVLRGILGVKAFYDDVRVSGRNKKEHDERLRMVLTRFREAGLTLKLEKCKIGQSRISFIGYEMDKKGIHISEDKIKAIAQIPPPQNVKELQIFLGMINYYSRFIKNFASVVSPLYDLLRKEKEFKWTKKCANAFEEIKTRMASHEVLMYYDPSLPIKVTCDASPTGIGAVIAHVLAVGSDRPIAFTSRALSKAERNYSQLDKEALAIANAVKAFHQYVYGRHFTLETDHKPLIHIFGDKKGIPQMAASRLQRWSVFLSRYNYKIQFIKGTDNVAADCLSRLHSDLIEDDTSQDYSYLNFVQESVPTITLDVIQEETDNDIVLKKVREFVKNGWQDEIQDAYKPFYSKRDELAIENECLTWGHRVIIPSELRPKMLEELHDAHMGVVKMKSQDLIFGGQI